jgi:hypothetical protein
VHLRPKVSYVCGYVCVFVYACVLGWGGGRRGVAVMSQTQYTAGSLPQAMATVMAPSTQVFGGAFKDNTANLLSGWSWVDGSPASNLNCGSSYCKPLGTHAC